MKSAVKETLLLLARFLGLFSLARHITRHDWRILAYHGIWLGDGHFGNHLFMRADTFARRMELLRERGYTVLPLGELLEHGEDHDAPVAITIDDGWLGTYRHMLPVLEAERFPATLYLYTGYVQEQRPVAEVALGYLFHRAGEQGLARVPVQAGATGAAPSESSRPLNEAASLAAETLRTLPTPEARHEYITGLAEQIGVNFRQICDERWLHLMTAEEVADAARRGLDMQLHTHAHTTTQDGQDVLAQQIEANRDTIASITGSRAAEFCYPSGVYTAENWPTLRECGVNSATTTEQGLAGPDVNPYALPRLMDGESVSALEFEAELSGFMTLARKGLRSLRGG